MPDSTGSARQVAVGLFGTRDTRRHADAGLFVAWCRRVGLVQTAAADTTLFQQGTACQQIGYLEEGWITLLRTEGTGVDVIVGLRQAGALIGGAAAFSNLPHPMTVVARSTVRLWTVALPLVEQALREDQAIRHALLRDLARETIAHAERCGALGCLDARTHLERILAELSALSPVRPARIPVGVTELAGLLGVDASHVRRLVRRLEQEGLIENRRGRITVPDPHRLTTPSAG